MSHFASVPAHNGAPLATPRYFVPTRLAEPRTMEAFFDGRHENAKYGGLVPPNEDDE